ncbi:TPA: hypothetical protein OTZ38_005738, partial [Klebsiella michiganensis]|nr:hypothetical protein [Klebsiella michiganensis]
DNNREITDEDISEILAALRMILPIVRSASPNYIQSLIGQNVNSKKPRIENIIRLARDKSIDPIKKALLTYTLMDIRDENIKEGVVALLKERNSLVTESLFLKMNMLINTNYDLRNEDIRYLKSTLQNMVVQGKVTQRHGLESYLNKLN